MWLCVSKYKTIPHYHNIVMLFSHGNAWDVLQWQKLTNEYSNFHPNRFLDPKILCSLAELWGKDAEFCTKQKMQWELGKSIFTNCKNIWSLHRSLRIW